MTKTPPSKNSFHQFVEYWRQRFFLALTLKFFAGLVIGFGLGVYFLPILIADEPADIAIVQAAADKAERQAVFRRDLPGSDALHWGEGTLYLSSDRVTLEGEVSPGPDYRLYLAPSYVEDEEGFAAIKAQSLEIARIKGFRNFSYEIPAGLDTAGYAAVVIWCERFSQFITAGRLTKRG
ncbi:DM13 domain-containing protein [Alphaproteobacteria bacterium LSUCC0684]